MKSTDKGFTLLELMVATALLGIVCAVVITGFGLNMKSAGIADGYIRADRLLKQLAVEAQAKGAFEAGVTEGKFEDADGYRWQKIIRESADGTFYEAELTVSFTRAGDERSVSVSTVFTPYETFGGEQ